ncbi:MAG TPA: hypothetical protein VKY82_09800 [Flavobacterium sp.]|nr:hypothetical protein [Flavobacterium sp.]
MKQFIAFVWFLALFTSCKVTKNVEQNKEKLTGKWILTKATFSDDLMKDFDNDIPYLNFDHKEGISGSGNNGCVKFDFIVGDKAKNREISVTIMEKFEGFGRISGHWSFNESEFKREQRWRERCEKVKHKELSKALAKSISYKLKKDTILIFQSKDSEIEFQKVIQKNE